MKAARAKHLSVKDTTTGKIPLLEWVVLEWGKSFVYQTFELPKNCVAKLMPNQGSRQRFTPERRPPKLQTLRNQLESSSANTE